MGRGSLVTPPTNFRGVRKPQQHQYLDGHTELVDTGTVHAQRARRGSLRESLRSCGPPDDSFTSVFEAWPSRLIVDSSTIVWFVVGIVECASARRAARSKTRREASTRVRLGAYAVSCEDR
jgi:hypothetical protein